MEQAVFSHEGTWTEDAYLALRHDGRVEVVDGTLLVGPGVGKRRARAVERVRAAVSAVLPEGLRVIGPAPLRLGPDCVLMPDLVVTSALAEGADGKGAAKKSPERGGAAAAAPEVLDAAAALMVIEVIGCDHGAADRFFKPQLYARSRIPYSLLIDHDGPFAVAELIISGRYHEYAHGAAGQALHIEEPFELTLDLDAVTAAEPVPAGQAPVVERAAKA